MRWMGRLARRLLVGAGVVMGLLLIVEIGLAIAGLRFRFAPTCDWDPRLGCMTRANADAEFAFARVRFRFHTNSLGLRDRERGAKPAGVRRVLILGDSLPFGVLVDEGQTFPALLEARLGAGGIEVVNGGSIHLKASEQQLGFYLDRGRALRPDLVVLAFNAQNDFADNSHRLFWRRRAEGGGERPGEGARIERVAEPRPASGLHRLVIATKELSAVRLLDAHSSLFGLVRGLGFNLMHLPASSASRAEVRAATDDTIVRLDEEVRADGARFAVAVFPNPETTDELGRSGRVRQGAEEPDAVAIVEGHHIPYVDLTARLVTPAGGERLFQDDNHLTVRGHVVVAEAMAPRISEWLGR